MEEGNKDGKQAKGRMEEERKEMEERRAKAEQREGER